MVTMITIHTAQVEEIPQIKALLSKTWIDTYGAWLPQATIQTVTSTWHAPEKLRREIEHAFVYFVVAKNEADEIVGLATAHGPAESTIHLSRLYIDPDAQRQGIGSRLLQAVIDHYPQARAVQLEVEPHNTKGYSFYSKKGFRETGRQHVELDGVSIEVAEMTLTLAR